MGDKYYQDLLDALYGSRGENIMRMEGMRNAYAPSYTQPKGEVTQYCEKHKDKIVDAEFEMIDE